MINYNKPIGLNEKKMDNNRSDKRTKILKEVVSELTYALYHNPEGIYRKVLINKAIRDLKKFYG